MKKKSVSKKKKVIAKKGIVKIVGSSPAHEYEHIHIKDEPELDRGLVFGSKEHIARWRQEQENIQPLLKTSNPNSIHQALQDKTKASGEIIPDKRLTFNSVTGELIVSNKPIDSDTNIVVDQIYKDGFFARKAA